MKVRNFLKAAIGKAAHFKDGVDKSKVISFARDEVHQLAYGLIVKQLIMVGAVSFVFGLIFGAIFGWVFG